MQHGYMRKVWSILLTGVLAFAGLIGVQTVANAATVGDATISITGDTAYSSYLSAVSGKDVFIYEYQATQAGTLIAKSCNSDVATTLLLKTSGASQASDVAAVNAISGTETATASSTCTKGYIKNFTLLENDWYYLIVTLSASNKRPRVEVDFTTDTPPRPEAAYVKLDRVTICHRTHATTNPYRLITVSAASIVGAGDVIRGHGKHAPDSKRYVESTEPDKYGVFDSAKPYKPSQKYWEDIIPPFESNKAGGGKFPGLNWYWNDPDPLTDTIFSKEELADQATGSTNATAQAAMDLCLGSSGNLTAKQYFDLERKGGGKSRQEILDEMKDDDTYEDAVYKEKDNLEKELPAKEGPKNPPVNTIAQSLDGVVWLDKNRNGFQEDDEPLMSNIKVTIAQGNSPATAMIGGRFTGFGTGARILSDTFGANRFTTFLDAQTNRFSGAANALRSLFGMATTYTVYTDGNGYFIFKSLASGDWYVAGVVPAGLDVTYDSSGVADATVDTTVPAGGHASTWIGLMGDSNTGINSKVYNPDGTLATKDIVLTASGIDGIFCNSDDVSFILTPVNGVISLTGLPNSSYYVRQIGTTSTIADFDVTTGQIYNKDIRTVAGQRCELLIKPLASTGAFGIGQKLLGMVILLSLGALFVSISVRRITPKNSI